MKRGRRLLLVLTVAAGFGAVGTIAWAYFSAPGSGNATANVATLSTPTGVTASAVGSTVHVSWTGVAAPDGSATVAYWVQRFSGSTPTDACGSSHASPVAIGTGARSCDDAGVASGTYTYKVTAVFRTWTATSSASAPVTVNAATLDHFTVTAPSAATAGTAFSVTVVAKDATNSTLSGYVGTVHFSTSDLNSPVLPSNYTFVSGDNGTHTFSNAVTLKTAGAQTVSVNDTVQTTKTGTSSSITVGATALDHFVVTGPASATVANGFSDATVKARDVYDNPATTWTSATKCVTFSGPANAPLGTAPNYPAPGACSAGQSSLSFDATGQASGFAITLYKAETTSLTATASAKTGTSSSFVVSPGPATGFLVTAPSTATAGIQFTGTSLTARDAYNNVATAYAGSKPIVWSGPGNAPNGTAPTFPATSVSFTAGVSTTALDATLVKAEGATLTATQTSGPSGSASITVNPGTAANFLVTAPASATAGTQFAVTSLTARDAFNNIATGYVGSKTIAWSGPNNAPNGTAPTFPATSVSFTAGISTTTLNATLVKAENATLTASATSPTVVGSASITINPGTAANFQASAPASATAGTSFAVTSLTARDAFNNTATAYTGTHPITWTGAGNAPSGTVPTFTTSVAFTAGVSTTTLTTTLYKAETASIVVAEGAINNGAGFSITVNPAAASVIQLASCNVNGTIGACTAPFSLGNSPGNVKANVRVTDAYGNTPAATTVSFTITSANGNYTVAGSPVSITAGTTSTTQFTVTHANNGSNNAVITVHATSGSYTDFTFLVQK